MDEFCHFAETPRPVGSEPALPMTATTSVSQPIRQPSKRQLIISGRFEGESGSFLQWRCHWPSRLRSWPCVPRIYQARAEITIEPPELNPLLQTLIAQRSAE